MNVSAGDEQAVTYQHCVSWRPANEPHSDRNRREFSTEAAAVDFFDRLCSEPRPAGRELVFVRLTRRPVGPWETVRHVDLTNQGAA